MVQGALLMGCRYSELGRMRVQDFNPEVRVIHVRESKSGYARHVALNDEGLELLSSLSASKSVKELIFLRSDGRQWKAAQQQHQLFTLDPTTRLVRNELAIFASSRE
jgi:integrase